MVRSAPGLMLAGEATDAEGLLRSCRRLGPDVVLLDTRMAAGRCADLVAGILAATPRTQVIALADRSEEGCVVLRYAALHALEPPVDDCLTMCLKAGARGALRKTCSEDDVIEAICRVHAGDLWVEMPTASRYIDALSAAPPQRHHEGCSCLTDRELQVVGLVTAGLPNKEIAKTLGISEQTVKNHISRVLSKLGLGDRLQVAMYAVRAGIVPCPSESPRQRGSQHRVRFTA